jgi:hypothetical protein
MSYLVTLKNLVYKTVYPRVLSLLPDLIRSSHSYEFLYARILSRQMKETPTSEIYL